MDWITTVNYFNDVRHAVQIRHIKSGNDGDVSIATITELLLFKKKAPLCIDIGVDEGWWSFFTLDMNPESQVIAFEPNPISYRALLPYIADDSRIQLHNIAISDKEGELQFFLGGGQSHSRVLSEKLADVSVPCETINKYIEGKDIEIVKIDTEGHELSILMSLRPYLDRITSIIFEFTPYWYDSEASAIEHLTYLSTVYPTMYVLSRRGAPELDPIHIDNIPMFVKDNIIKEYQCDILCTRDSQIIGVMNENKVFVE